MLRLRIAEPPAQPSAAAEALDAACRLEGLRHAALTLVFRPWDTSCSLEFDRVRLVLPPDSGWVADETYDRLRPNPKITAALDALRAAVPACCAELAATLPFENRVGLTWRVAYAGCCLLDPWEIHFTGGFPDKLTLSGFNLAPLLARVPDVLSLITPRRGVETVLLQIELSPDDPFQKRWIDGHFPCDDPSRLPQDLRDWFPRLLALWPPGPDRPVTARLTRLTGPLASRPPAARTGDGAA